MVIPKEQLAAYERWEIGSFDRKPNPPSADEPEPPPVTVTELPEDYQPALSLPTAEGIELIHEEARASGYAAGYEEGKAQGEQAARDQAEELLNSLTGILTNLSESLSQFDQQVADSLLNLGVEIASQITRSIVNTRSDLLLPVIREAIAALPLHHGHVVLSLNPKDATLIRPLLGEQFAQTGAQLLEDSSITPGGCLVRAGASEIDASIETRWKRVLETIGSTPQDWLKD